MSTALLTTKQAAALLGVSESFLQRDRWAGARIPFVRVGVRAVRYRPEAIAEYLNMQTRRSTSDVTRKKDRRRPPQPKHEDAQTQAQGALKRIFPS